MAYENIQTKYRNFTGGDGYFYYFDQAQDNLIVKTDDGNIAFTYPLDTAITNEVVSLEFDGFNFWTLENPSGSVIIRRWQIDNYVCVLQYTKNLTDDGSNTYDSNAMTVEHYHFAFGADETTGQNNISTTDPKGIVTDISDKIDSGMKVSFGPSTESGYEGDVEEFSVNSAGTDFILINSTTSSKYKAGDPINTYKYVWMFNNYNQGPTTEGALYKFEPYTDMSPVGGFPIGGNEYDNIEACTFAVIPEGLKDAGGSDIVVNALTYVRGSNMLFKDVVSLDNYGSMAMDNINSNELDILVVYDLMIYENNVYRLQRQATYYGSTTTFADSAYSYQLATLTPFVHSISLQAVPAVIPADSGSSSSLITAVVKSQFLLAINGRQVTFSDDNTNGYLSDTNVLTGPPNFPDGVAETTYYSGSDATEVKITATAKQS
jgi:hypothetical protein